VPDEKLSLWGKKDGEIKPDVRTETDKADAAERLELEEEYKSMKGLKKDT
jgi:hypothetical protein